MLFVRGSFLKVLTQIQREGFSFFSTIFFLQAKSQIRVDSLTDRKKKERSRKKIYLGFRKKRNENSVLNIVIMFLKEVFINCIECQWFFLHTDIEIFLSRCVWGRGAKRRSRGGLSHQSMMEEKGMFLWRLGFCECLFRLRTELNTMLHPATLHLCISRRCTVL